ncbi:MAG TPA: transcription antitermination factor NusB [bacterium]|nr:transcription antitermination factor NusB [bacterium]HPJ71145.1 transcription antitermination factor NusB [bacterium]
MGSRRQAREQALQILYGHAVNPGELRKAIDDYFASVPRDEESRRYAERLVLGVEEHRDEIDGRLRGIVKNWSLGRIGLVDLSILRLAIFEMTYEREVPSPVAINEAIEIAKRYGSEQSSRFINGVLDKARAEAADEAD